MAERRSLVEGLKSPPSAVNPVVEKDFVYQTKTPSMENGQAVTPPQKPAPAQIARAPLSTRIRADYAQALKRASLERKLAGTEPNTLQGILEEAVEPWLRTNGYLSP